MKIKIFRQIQKESDAYIKEKGKVKTGGAAMTNGGRLPCKKVIHAVGPIWSNVRKNIY